MWERFKPKYVLLILIVFLIAVECKRGGGSSFRSTSGRSSSTYRSTSGRSSRSSYGGSSFSSRRSGYYGSYSRGYSYGTFGGYSRYSGYNSWNMAMMGGAFYMGTRYHSCYSCGYYGYYDRHYYKQQKEPTFCSRTIQVEQLDEATNTTKLYEYEHIMCPMVNQTMLSGYDYCCGEEKFQWCCQFDEYSSVPGWAIALIVVVVIVIICVLIYCLCCRNRDHGGHVISGGGVTVVNNYPAQPPPMVMTYQDPNMMPPQQPYGMNQGAPAPYPVMGAAPTPPYQTGGPPPGNIGFQGVDQNAQYIGGPPQPYPNAPPSDTKDNMGAPPPYPGY